jgi:hypothetical protein
LRLPSVDLQASFERHLRAENKSARTAETYLEAVLFQHFSSGPRLRAGIFSVARGLTGLSGWSNPVLPRGDIHDWLREEAHIQRTIVSALVRLAVDLLQEQTFAEPSTSPRS